MLSDKEKKAIELLEDHIICGNKEGVLYRNLRIISRIIKKQSKEIEELKEKNKLLGVISLSFKEIQDRDKKWEDKIEAKIEELEKMNIHEFETMNVLEVLQSLLEKE